MPPKSKTTSKTVSAPVSKQRIVQITRRAQNKQPFLVREKEYIGDVSGSVAFAVTSYSVNPGLFATFPWLSAIAQNYESYRIRKLKICYETETSTAKDGSVMIAFDYDAADAAPGDKTKIMSYEGATRGPVWSPFSVEYRQGSGSSLSDMKYIRSSSLASNLDVKTYDCANFFVATKGMADGSSIGELYLEYEIELLTPQLSDRPRTFCKVSFTSPDDATPCGSAATVTGDELLAWTSTTTSTLQRSGEWLLSYVINGTVITAIGAITSSTGTLTAVSGPSISGGAGHAQYTYLYKANAGDVLTFGANTSTTQTAATLRFGAYDVDLA